MDIQNIKILALFIEGMLSFFSPCVIPIIPIYLSILANKGEKNSNRKIIFYKNKLFLNSIFFVLGISTTFFILAFATSYLSIFLNKNITIIQTISAILIIFMGLVQVGILKFNFLKKEISLKNKIKTKKVNPFIAFLMGFTFSFSWSPCIGPILASVFLYASSHTGTFSIILITIYSIGFILPFLIISIFSSKVLNLIKRNVKLLEYTTMTSGIILILIGISIFTGYFNCFVNKYFI